MRGPFGLGDDVLQSVPDIRDLVQRHSGDPDIPFEIAERLTQPLGHRRDLRADARFETMCQRVQDAIGLASLAGLQGLHEVSRQGQLVLLAFQLGSPHSGLKGLLGALMSEPRYCAFFRVQTHTRSTAVIVRLMWPSRGSERTHRRLDCRVCQKWLRNSRIQHRSKNRTERFR